MSRYRLTLPSLSLFLRIADRLFHFDFFLLTSHFLFCVIRFLDLLLYCLSVTYVIRKDKSKRDKNGTKSARKYLNLGKYNGLIKNRPLFITNYKSMRFYRFRYIWFPMFLPICNNWWLLEGFVGVAGGVRPFVEQGGYALALKAADGVIPLVKIPVPSG